MSQITGLLPTLARADGLKSVEALKQAVNDGTIPGYIGVPMIADLIKKQQQARGMAQQQPTQTVEDQVYAQAEQMQNPQPMPQQMPPQMPPPQQPMPQPTQLAGITGAQSNLPTQNMAAGGIVAFAGGGLGDDDYNSEDDEDNEEYYADIASKNRQAKMIASQAESNALTDALMQQAAEQQGGYGYGVNPEQQAAEQQSGYGYSINPEQQGAVNRGITYKDPLPSGGARGIQDTAFINKIRHLESRGRDYDEKGGILTSPKGAMASMQTMPNTLRDPGFGVKPAQNNSVEEMNRVGRDYGNAMLQRYGNEKDAAMAYNWGPGNMDKWIAGGRKGPVPGETRQYASNFKQGGIVQLAGGGAVAFQAGGSTMAGFELDTPSESDVISTPDLDAGYTIDPMTGEKMFSGYRARKPSKPPTSQINISPSYVSDEDSGPYIDGQPPITAAPLLNKPLTEPQKSAEELFYEQMVKANEIRAASNKSEKTMDNYLALIQAGLGMMGGTSPYAFANIGQGGSAGISYLANARKQQGLNERGLARNQMDLLTARQSMTTAKENRLSREKIAAENVITNRQRVIKEVEGQRAKAVEAKLKSHGINEMIIDELERKKFEGKLDEAGLKKLEGYKTLRSRAITEAKSQYTIPTFDNIGGVGWSASIVKPPGT